MKNMVYIIDHFAYLLVLLVGLGGMMVIDKHYRLSFWDNTPASGIAILASTLLLLLLDIAGIGWQIFYTNQKYVMNINIVNPNLPVEEILLLVLIGYLCCNLYQASKRLVGQ